MQVLINNADKNKNPKLLKKIGGADSTKKLMKITKTYQHEHEQKMLQKDDDFKISMYSEDEEWESFSDDRLSFSEFDEFREGEEESQILASSEFLNDELSPSDFIPCSGSDYTESRNLSSTSSPHNRRWAISFSRKK